MLVAVDFATDLIEMPFPASTDVSNRDKALPPTPKDEVLPMYMPLVHCHKCMERDQMQSCGKSGLLGRHSRLDYSPAARAQMFSG